MTSAGSETLSYDLTNGLLTGTTLGSVTDSYSYSGFGEVDNYTAQVSAVDQFATGFTRDKLGRITSKTETVQGVARTFDYTYNDAGYLVEVKRDSVVQSTYTYDLNGNRENNGAVYDDQDRLTSTATASYTYTDNGELLTKTESGQVTAYTYDVLGNLKQVVLPSGTVIDYLIDGRNRRIGKKVDGVLQQAWLYKDDLNPIAELDGSGNIVSRFMYASRANIPDFVIKGGITYRIISDHLGSPRLVINTADGTVVQAVEYDEWGNVLSDTNPRFTSFSFAGGLYDADTKLIRFGARDYDPEVGRWTSKDPIRLAGGDTNLFGYVSNDPVNFVDLNGLFTNPTGGGIRNDSAGKGTYGASRGSKTHVGADYEGPIGSNVVSPISGTVERVDDHTIRITSTRKNGVQHSVRLKHVDHNITKSRSVKEGETIATVMDPLIEYPNEPKMKPHVHLELYKNTDKGKTTERLNPEDLIPLPKPLLDMCGGKN